MIILMYLQEWKAGGTLGKAFYSRLPFPSQGSFSAEFWMIWLFCFLIFPISFFYIIIFPFPCLSEVFLILKSVTVPTNHNSKSPLAILRQPWVNSFGQTTLPIGAISEFPNSACSSEVYFCMASYVPSNWSWTNS